MNLLLYQGTMAEVDTFLKKPSHALLIEGSAGAGKETLACFLAAKFLGVKKEGLNNQPYFRLIKPIDDTISIESVRDLKQFVSLKTTGTAKIRRVIVTLNVETLTIEAQNAFLKLLEEPPADTVIIMTTSSALQLLPTVRSRVQKLRVHPAGQAEARAYFANQDFKSEAIDKAYMLSEGHAGLMSLLLRDDDTQPLVTNIQTAKELLSLSPYERLVRLDTVVKDRAEAERLLQALQLICHTGLKQASNYNNLKTVRRWHHALEKTLQAQADLSHRPNLKLFMTDLLLTL